MVHVRKKSVILVFIALLSTTHAYSLTNWLLTLGADAMIMASLASNVHKQSSLSNRVNAYWDMPPTAARKLSQDLARVSPHASVLMPIGIGLAGVSRFSMISKSPLTGLIKAGTSIPVNICLITLLYGVRLYQAYDEAGWFGKKADELWSWLRTE